MATLDILPLAFDGIKPPINLLYNLISNKGSSNLFYPMELGSNPNYGHAVIFSIKDYNYQITQEVNNLLGGGNFSLGNLLTIPNYKAQALNQSLATISLYMPDTLAVNYNHDFTQASLTDSFGLGSFLASAIADLPGAAKGADSDKGNWTNMVAKGLGPQLGEKITGIKDFASIAGNVLKMVPNPHLQLLYKGVQLREFQFEFIFTPTSQKEAQMVEQIIKTFEYYSAPGLLGARSHQYLEPPQIFNIKFAFIGGNGISAGLNSFFRNIGTNILTSQISGALFGSNLNPNQPPPAKIFQIYHDCVLTSMNLDYAPNGWAAFGDGYPVQTRMTLQFKEMDIVSKQDIDQKKFDADHASAFSNYIPDKISSSLLNDPGSSWNINNVLPNLFK